MNTPAAESKKICSHRCDLAAYVDGELSPREELILEAHLAVCAACRTELNEQKKMLCALNFALEDETDFPMPANFTEIVVANAESKVSGLRRPQERSKALLVCAVLFTLGLSSLGGETQTILRSFADFAEQFLVVGKFALHLFYDIALGAAIILRATSSHLVSDAAAWLAVIAFGIICAALLRFIVRIPGLKVQAQEK